MPRESVQSCVTHRPQKNPLPGDREAGEIFSLQELLLALGAEFKRIAATAEIAIAVGVIHA